LKNPTGFLKETNGFFEFAAPAAIDRRKFSAEWSQIKIGNKREKESKFRADCSS